MSSSTSDVTADATLPPNPALNPPPFIYKIVPLAAWQSSYESSGKYTGSELDLKDGFIHISDKEHTVKTAELYFAQEKEIVLVQLNVKALLATGNLRWDWAKSRQAYFPHYYDLTNGIQKEHIEKITHVKWDEEKKKHALPELE